MADWFITEEAFKTKVDAQKEAEAITQWVDIPNGKLFNIEKIIETRIERQGEIEEFHILILQDKFLDTIKTYAPRRLIRMIKDKRKPTERVFITCMGQGKYKKKYPINNFDITYQDAGKNITLFEKFQAESEVP